MASSQNSMNAETGATASTTSQSSAASQQHRSMIQQQCQSSSDGGRGRSATMTSHVPPPNTFIYPSYPSAAAWMHPALALSSMNANTMAKFTWRKGKWTEEEEAFTKKLIDAFNGGYLKIASGTTLRSFLAERLFWYV